MAYDFNGSTQYLGISSAVSTVVPVTMACWFNTRNNSLAQNLISINSSTSDNRLVLQCRGDVANDPIRVQVNGNGSTNTDTTTGYSTNVWTHACGVFSAANNRSAYINGGSSATNTFSLSPSGLNQTSIASQRFQAFPDGISFFDGLIAEVGIWNVALTTSEILSLSKGITCDNVRPQSLVFYAPLVRNLVDLKGGLTITNNNTATTAAHPRVYL
jgi:hypothetical protein